jgi:hypothetical protein
MSRGRAEPDPGFGRRQLRCLVGVYNPNARVPQSGLVERPPQGGVAARRAVDSDDDCGHLARKDLPGPVARKTSCYSQFFSLAGV